MALVAAAHSGKTAPGDATALERYERHHHEQYRAAQRRGRGKLRRLLIQQPVNLRAENIKPKRKSQNQFQLESLQRMNDAEEQHHADDRRHQRHDNFPIVRTTPAPDTRDASSSVASMLRNAGVKSITSTAIVEVVRCAQTMPQNE